MRQTAILPGIFLVCLFATAGTASSQTPSNSAGATAVEQLPAGNNGVTAANENGAITLDVVVEDKSGAPVGGLEPGDFKLLDNKLPQGLVSVQAENGMRASADPPVEAIVVIDAINSTFLSVSNARQWVANFLKENGGELALPTSMVVLTDHSMARQKDPSRNGMALLEFLDANATGLREIKRAQGWEGAMEREQASLSMIDALAAQEQKSPGRKLVIWVSPGWHLISNYSWNGSQKDQEILFDSIVSASTELRAARMTVYSIDPAGVGRGQWAYQSYLKGVDSPRHADFGSLMLQVLAAQTGGQVLEGNNDLAGLIDRCIADAKAYYVLTFHPGPAAHPNEYHSLAVQVDKPGLKVRTRTGYYAQATMMRAQWQRNIPFQSVEDSKGPQF